MAEQNAKRGVHDEQMSVERRLTKLEDDIRRLKIEYDMYFNGALKRPPHDTKNRVESTIKRIGDDRSLTYAQKYHYNSLTARYTAFRELWRRNVREREEGRTGAFQRAAARGAETASQAAGVKNYTCGDVGSEPIKVKEIYSQLIRAKQECGEDTSGFAYENFQRQLVAQMEKFKQINACSQVNFSVGVENGKVLFKAKAA